MKVPSRYVSSMADVCPCCDVGPEWVPTDEGADYELICGCCGWQVIVRPKKEGEHGSKEDA